MEARKKIKPLSDFIKISTLEARDISGTFCHDVMQTKKIPPAQDIHALKYNYVWYLKLTSKNIDAWYEIVAQELYRLYLPGHPKTRMVVDATQPHIKYYVASKEVSNSVSVNDVPEQQLCDNLSNGNYFGLGGILVISLLLNEIDLKLDNLKLTNTGQIVKIDGDCCFARLQGWHGDYDVSNYHLAYLPNNCTYRAHNWLNFICTNAKGQSVTKQIHLGASFSGNIKFREEINSALLKICIMPNSIIKRFISHYVDDINVAEEILEEYTKRAAMIKQSALENPDFKLFLKSVNAKKALDEFLLSLQGFTMTKKISLLDKSEESKDLKQLQKNYIKLTESIKTFSRLQLNQVETAYKNYRNRFFYKHWIFAAEEGHSFLQKFTEAPTDEDRYQRARIFMKLHGSTPLATILSNVLNVDTLPGQSNSITACRTLHK